MIENGKLRKEDLIMNFNTWRLLMSTMTEEEQKMLDELKAMDMDEAFRFIVNRGKQGDKVLLSLSEKKEYAEFTMSLLKDLAKEK